MVLCLSLDHWNTGPLTTTRKRAAVPRATRELGSCRGPGRRGLLLAPSPPAPARCGRRRAEPVPDPSPPAAEQAQPHRERASPQPAATLLGRAPRPSGHPTLPERPSAPSRAAHGVASQRSSSHVLGGCRRGRPDDQASKPSASCFVTCL